MVVNCYSRCGRVGSRKMTKYRRSRRLDDVVIPDVSQPVPKTSKRNLVMFGVGYSPGNRRRCDCRSKFTKCPIKNTVNICSCLNKHECKCETKVSKADEKTDEWMSSNCNINENVVDRDLTKGSKSSVQFTDNGHNQVGSQCFMENPATLQTFGSQDQPKLKCISSHNPVNNIEDIRKAMRNLCIAISQQLMLLKNGKMPYLDKYLLQLDYIELGNEMTKLYKALENGRGIQNSEDNIIFIIMECQLTRFKCIKDRHENLIRQFKNHRKRFIFSALNNESKT